MHFKDHTVPRQLNAEWNENWLLLSASMPSCGEKVGGKMDCGCVLNSCFAVRWLCVWSFVSCRNRASKAHNMCCLISSFSHRERQTCTPTIHNKYVMRPSTVKSFLWPYPKDVKVYIFIPFWYNLWLWFPAPTISASLANSYSSKSNKLISYLKIF